MSESTDRLSPISAEHVRQRPVYYLWCGKCGLADLQDDDYLTRVVNRATSIGWRYDNEKNYVVCPVCARLLAEKGEKRK